MWHWSERDPYEFLEGRPRIYADVDSGGGYTEYYAFSETATRVDELISKEVAPDKPGRDWVFEFGRGYGPVSMRRYPFEIMATGAFRL